MSTKPVAVTARPARIRVTPFVAKVLARVTSHLETRKASAARKALDHWLCPPTHTLPNPDHRFLRPTYNTMLRRGRPVAVHVRPSGQAATIVAAIHAATSIPTAHIWAKALTRGALELAESLSISTDPADYPDQEN